MSNPNDLQTSITQLSKQIQEVMDILLTQPSHQTSGTKLFIQGTFTAFEEDTQTLCITINHQIEYYPLQQYACAWLPFIGDTVQIYRADGEPQIIGFMQQGEEIPEAPKIAAKIRSYHPVNKSLTIDVNSKLLKLNVPQNIIDQQILSAGQIHIFKHIQAPPYSYYIPLECEKNTRQTVEILRMMK